jgi:hypothetical protein
MASGDDRGDEAAAHGPAVGPRFASSTAMTAASARARASGVARVGLIDEWHKLKRKTLLSKGLCS